jgi:hypothetical protein
MSSDSAWLRNKIFTTQLQTHMATALRLLTTLYLS